MKSAPISGPTRAERDVAVKAATRLHHDRLHATSRMRVLAALGRKANPDVELRKVQSSRLDMDGVSRKFMQREAMSFYELAALVEDSVVYPRHLRGVYANYDALNRMAGALTPDAASSMDEQRPNCMRVWVVPLICEETGKGIGHRFAFKPEPTAVRVDAWVRYEPGMTLIYRQ